MSDPFVAQLADLCKAHVTRAKWVFVPSHGVGRTIGELKSLIDNSKRLAQALQGMP